MNYLYYTISLTTILFCGSSSACNICGTENQVITLPTNEINIAGVDETPVLESCIAYQTSVTESNVSDEECAMIQATLGDCGCAPEGSAEVPTTFAPTVSPAPTVTAQPTNPEPACLICGQEGMRVGNPDATVEIFGVPATCGGLEFENTRNYDLAPPEICEIVMTAVMAGCECTAEKTDLPEASASSSRHDGYAFPLLVFTTLTVPLLQALQ